MRLGADGTPWPEGLRPAPPLCGTRGMESPCSHGQVVHVAGPRQNWPGGGYFAVNGLAHPSKERASAEDEVRGTRFWEDQKQQCKDGGVRERRRG